MHFLTTDNNNYNNFRTLERTQKCLQGGLEHFRKVVVEHKIKVACLMKFPVTD